MELDTITQFHTDFQCFQLSYCLKYLCFNQCDNKKLHNKCSSLGHYNFMFVVYVVDLYIRLFDIDLS